MTGRNRSIAFAAAVLAAAALPAVQPAYAQAEARSSPVPRYHLMQLSVEADRIPLEQFAARTSAVTSCGEAKALGKAIDAQINRNRFVRASALPSDLQGSLEAMPIGHATQVFSADGSVLRVIVLCARN